MRVNRAKRRLMKWYRYINKTNSMSTNRNHKPYHAAHVKAYANVMYARRWVPIGIREPWVLTSEPGNGHAR